jgi:hypothetical protein
LIFDYLLIIISFYVLIEILCYLTVRFVNKKFQWMIIGKDETPKLSKEGLEKFFEHSYDEELGWVRKPKTSHEEKGKEGIIKWNVNSIGARINPKFENKESIISCYGDSFTFGRQVKDSQTWEHYLSKLTNSNVQNFGVGNYGIDQSLIRMKREYSSNPTKIVILAVVPDTISRIMSMWKHYYEYGNTFAFKPKFIIKNNELQLINNQIDNKEKFYEYEKFLPKIKKYDYFYFKKFKKEKIQFPYLITILKNPKRNLRIISKVIFKELSKKNKEKKEYDLMNIIMEINLKWRLKLFENYNAITLLNKIIKEFVTFSEKNNFQPVFIFLPQKDDLIFIKKKYNFMKKTINEITNITKINYVDIIDEFLESQNLDEYYSDDNDYGGHFSKEGNEKIASIIKKELTKKGILS